MPVKVIVRPESKYEKREALPDGLPSNLPGAKITMDLYELSISVSDSLNPIETYSGVQTMDGSLQPLSAREISEYRETVKADYQFLVSNSVFLSVLNEAKLNAKNQIRLGTRKFDIVFVENRTEGFMPHYKVLLNEVV